MSTELHIHIHNDFPDQIARQLDRIEQALNVEIQEIEIMTKVTDAALADIEASVANVSTVVDAVKAYIDANVTAQTTLAAELAAEGADVTKLQAFNTAIKANSDRLAALIVQGTPADTGAPIPPATPTV